MRIRSSAKEMLIAATGKLVSRLMPSKRRQLRLGTSKFAKRQTLMASFEQLEQRQLLAVNVIFDYRYDTHGFFSDPARRQALEAAGDVIGQSLNDRLSEINPQKASFLDGVERSWTVQFPIPNDEIVEIQRSNRCVSRNFLGICTAEEYVNRRTLKQIPAFTPASIDNLVVPENAIVVFVGSGDIPRDEDGGITLASSRTISPTLIRVSGPTEWQNAVRFRGQAGAMGSTQTDFATWGGSLIFNRDPSDVSWHSDLGTNPTGLNHDLFSVALHELGHVFGYTDGAASFKNQISATNNFTGRSSVQMFGGPIPLFVDDDGGIGHWDRAVRSPPDNLRPAMGPGIPAGTRRPFSALDFAGLDDIGWDVEQSASGIISQTVHGVVQDSNGVGIGGAWIQAACIATTSPRGCPFFLVPPILGVTRPDGSYTVSTSSLERGAWSLFSVVNGQVLETKDVNFNTLGQIAEVNFTAPASLSLVASTATSTSQGYLLSGSESTADLISIAAPGAKLAATINGVAFLTDSRDIVVNTGAMPDTINLDFSNGNPVGSIGSIAINAGQDAIGIGSDRVVVSGGNFDVFTYEIAG